MSMRFYLLFIAVLLLMTSVNHRDSNANPGYTCYVMEKGCE